MRLTECGRKGLILHPGAIGDCLLALPLAVFMKQRLGICQVDWIGRTEYIEFYPGRTAVDRIRSIDSIPLHRLFEDAGSFEVEDRDPLFLYFSGYQQVISFLGSEDPNFEQNLLYTIHCSQSAHVTMLATDTNASTRHISRYYLEQTALENEMAPEEQQNPPRLIEPYSSDFSAGRQILEDIGINPDLSVVLIHPGSGGRHKCWALENFNRLADFIKEAGHEVAFLLGPAETERWDEKTVQSIKYPVLTELSLTQVLQVLACADGYAGNDSGISHMAAAMAKPALAVFGPTNPDKFAPIGPKTKIMKIEEDLFKQSSAKTAQKAAEYLLEIL